MKYGKFIVVEGLEGVGKSLVIGFVKNILIDVGISVELIWESGGMFMVEVIRECVKYDWEEFVVEEIELLLMYVVWV